jgi:hypothetical protein
MMRSQIQIDRLGWVALLTSLLATPAHAGSPFLTDDAEPTPPGGYELYLFAAGQTGRDGVEGNYGVDLNYGAGPDLQLTMSAPIVFDSPDNGDFESGLGNVELAMKYRFLHQDSLGWDVAVFPRVVLESPSSVGDQHASFLLPIWLNHDEGAWSTFGGGGCAIKRGGDSEDYCFAGWAVDREMKPHLHIGGELYHQTADTKDGEPLTVFGIGVTYDLSEHVQLQGYAGAHLEHTDVNGRGVFYSSILFTF